MSPKNVKNLIFDKIKNKRTKPDTSQWSFYFDESVYMVKVVKEAFPQQLTLRIPNDTKIFVTFFVRDSRFASSQKTNLNDWGNLAGTYPVLCAYS